MPAADAKPTVAALFARSNPNVRATYGAVLEAARKLGPVRESPKKTSIHLENRTAFAGVGTRKNELVLTLKSGTRIRSPRIHKAEHLSANRWYLYVRLSEPAEVDREVRAWLAESYAIAL
jgi:predicted DNA-binding protein (MmcQ/YjbR family)